jgi:pSer/pThr/pTyr-binding forkhead associated (FHA) protein
MDLEIGIVCARCDRYAPMGAVRCVECENPLALVPVPPPGAPAVPVEPTPFTQPPAGALPRLRVPVVEPASVPRPAAIASVPPQSRGAPPRPAASGGAASTRAPETARRGGSSPEHPPPSREVRASTFSEPPPASLLGKEPLVPRRVGAPVAVTAPTPAGAASQGGIRAALATAPESAVWSPPSDLPPVLAGKPVPEAPSTTPDLSTLAASANLTLEELMDQAKNFVCRSCSTPVPVGHKFCGRCGAAVPPEILGARTQFFGQLQAPGKAKLILIRGEGVEGLSYQLNAEQHVVGRNGQLVFPDDPFVSPRHANLFYRNGKLVVRDEGSHNGVFVRVRGTVEIAAGDEFLAGEQLFKLDATPKANDGPAPDGTYFYSSPKHQMLFRVTQILQGGMPGMVVCARGSALQIGREGSDLNFPGDLYMSGSHCKIEELSGKFAITDMNSRNGTFLRIKAERELGHGDYLFIGRKLLRVEITAA